MTYLKSQSRFMRLTASLLADSDRDVIVVTATRREQNILDVPYNISAISGEEIEDSKILDNADLLRSIPGVAVVDRGARNSGTLNAVRMRGISVEGGGQGDIALSSVASVSTYVNDTPVFANFALTDLRKARSTAPARWAVRFATSHAIRNSAKPAAIFRPLRPA